MQAQSVSLTSTTYYNVTSESYYNFDQKFFDELSTANEYLNTISPKYFVKTITIPHIENIDAAFVKKCLLSKNDDGYPYHRNIITPKYWEGDILEARCHGESICCYGDTSDKFVLDPSHLGYPYDNIWSSEESWNDNTLAWADFRSNDEITNAFWNLFEVGRHLSSKCKVILFRMSGNAKGHTRVDTLKIRPNMVLDDENWIDSIVYYAYALHVYDNVESLLCKLMR